MRAGRTRTIRVSSATSASKGAAELGASGGVGTGATGAETSGRVHGDSYSEVVRDDDLIGTTSSHVPATARQPEEPSERALDDSERLEGSL